MLQVWTNSSLSVPPLVMCVWPGVDIVTYVDTVYRADCRPAERAGWALESTGEKACGSLYFRLVCCCFFACLFVFAWVFCFCYWFCLFVWLVGSLVGLFCFCPFELWSTATSDITNWRMQFVTTPALISGQGGTEKEKFLEFSLLSQLTFTASQTIHACISFLAQGRQHRIGEHTE